MADLLARPTTAAEARVVSSSDEPDTSRNSMKVVVRVRPESEAELRSSCHCVVQVLDEHMLIFDPAATANGGSREQERGGEEKV